MSVLPIETDPILGASGGDRTGRQAVRLVRNELTVQDILEALPEAVYTTDASGLITFYNSAAVQLWGVAPELGESEFCGSWKLYWPDGTLLPHDECPMALALKEQRAIRGKEAIAERPDGTRVAFLRFPTPLFDASGNLIGAVNMLVELTDRKIADEAAQRLVAIVESSDDAILAKDLNGVIVSWNRGAERLFGYTADEAVGRPITTLIPTDRHDEEPGILARLRRGERIDSYETIRRRKDGSLVEVSLTVSPVLDRDGRIVGAAKIARDITERRRAEAQLHLLIQEMDHRVKNLFSLANGLVGLSARSAATPEELAFTVSRRLNALSRAHALTVPRVSAAATRDEPEASLHALIHTIAEPYRDGAGDLVITGSDIPITGSLVTSFALLLHEFATNAAKYGAFSTPGGRIEIDCQENGTDFVFTWTESGGPPGGPGTSGEGFGTRLVNTTVQRQLGGGVSREWAPGGLVLRLVIPRDRLSSRE